MSGSFLGSSSSEEEINKMIKDYGAVFEVMDYDVLNKKIAKFINEGKVIGWYQGRSEFGPRRWGIGVLLAIREMPKCSQK